MLYIENQNGLIEADLDSHRGIFMHEYDSLILHSYGATRGDDERLTARIIEDPVD